jgi:hypothetical protein
MILPELTVVARALRHRRWQKRIEGAETGWRHTGIIGRLN